MSKFLDSQAANQIAFMSGFPLDLLGGELPEQRAMFADIIRQLHHSEVPQFDGLVEDSHVESMTTPPVHVRRYVPHGVRAGAGLVHIHGGGWVVGDLTTGGWFAAALAESLRVTVVSVNYRRAPEYPYPTPLLDCLAVADAARIEFPSWCGIAGDSAGGNLACATVLARRPPKLGFDAALLVYPCLDVQMSHPSHTRFADGYGLTREAMQFFWESYAGSGDRDDELLAPMAARQLQGLPPTILVTAGFDPLHDEGAEFARRLICAGVPTHYQPFPSLPHGFLDFTEGVDAAREAQTSVLRLLAAVAESGGLR